MNSLKSSSAELCAPPRLPVRRSLGDGGCVNPDPIQKPRKTVIPLTIGLAWPPDPGHQDGYTYQEKLDGRFETRRVRVGKGLPQAGRANKLGDTVLAGEYMQGEFYAFDLLILHGEDCHPWPLAERLEWLSEVFQCEPIDCTGGIIRRVQSARDGGKFLSEVLARGGEGVVRKHLASPWGAIMEACKRLETWPCIVTGFNQGQSVTISRIIGCVDAWMTVGKTLPAGTLQLSNHPLIHQSAPAGSVALLGGKADRVRIGSIIKVEGFGLTREGKIREPRPCKDTASSWLIQY